MARIGDSAHTSLKHILEAVLLAADEPLEQKALAALFEESERPGDAELGQALEELAEDYAERGLELRQVASGYRIQVREEVNHWVQRLWEERPQRYSRALLETLALIAYRQPITRGDIEEVRGVSVRSNIIRTLQEREWIRVVGHRDVPGKPALFGTTKAFLDYFNLESLDDLPSLAEIKDMDAFEPELDLEGGADRDDDGTGTVTDGSDAPDTVGSADDDEPGEAEGFEDSETGGDDDEGGAEDSGDFDDEGDEYDAGEEPRDAAEPR
jgi:segregation and condensation protein B